MLYNELISVEFNPTNPDYILAYQYIEKLWQESLMGKI